MYLVESTYQIITKYKTDTPISIYYLINSPYIVYEAHNEDRARSSYLYYKEDSGSLVCSMNTRENQNPVYYIVNRIPVLPCVQ